MHEGDHRLFASVQQVLVNSIAPMSFAAGSLGTEAAYHSLYCTLDS